MIGSVTQPSLDDLLWYVVWLGRGTSGSMGPWQAWGRCFEAMLLIKRGDTVPGLQRFSTAISRLRDIGHAVYYVAFTGE